MISTVVNYYDILEIHQEVSTAEINARSERLSKNIIPIFTERINYGLNQRQRLLYKLIRRSLIPQLANDTIDSTVITFIIAELEDTRKKKIRRQKTKAFMRGCVLFLTIF